MNERAKNTDFEAFKVRVGEVPFWITDVESVRKPDGDGIVRDWIKIFSSAEGGSVQEIVEIETPALLALAALAVRQQVLQGGSTAAENIQSLAKGTVDYLETIVSRIPEVSKPELQSFFDGIKRGYKRAMDKDKE